MSPRKEKTFHEFIIKYLKENTQLELNDKSIIVKDRFHRVDFKCKCGGIINRTSHYIVAYKIDKCKICNKKIQTSDKIDMLDKVIKYCKENLPHIHVISNEYFSMKTDLNFYCKIHNLEFKKKPSLMLINKSGCKQCFIESISAENNVQYNHDIPESERLKIRKASKIIHWKNELLKLYNNICFICGYNKLYNLVAHHKNSHDWCKKEAYDIENGVILCKNCHSEFHYIYGYGNNTKQQFEEYSKQFKKLG